MAPRQAVVPEITSNYIRSSDLDEAYLYGQQHPSDAEVNTSQVDLVALRKRIDRRIIPIMFACYTMQFLDKVIVNYAEEMGLKSDLHLKGNDFYHALLALFIACLIAEVPNGYILQKVPLATWLTFAVIASGIATAFMALTKNYTTMLVARIFLGIFQSVIAPCLMLIVSQYYTRSEQALRFSFWFCGLGFAQIVGGMVSFTFQHIGHVIVGMEGWRVMFLVLGFVTELVGILALCILPNTPMSVKWMSPAEKVRLLDHVSNNRTGIVNHRFKPWQVVELLLDIRIWILTLSTIFVSTPSGVILSYSSTLIHNSGYTPKIAALLNMPSGVFSILSVLAVGYGVSYPGDYNFRRRWSILVLCCIVGMMGGALMCSSKRALLLMGIYLVNTTTATVSLLYQWTMANVAGHTKRVFASALITAGFAVGNILGLKTFHWGDAPKQYPMIMIIEMQGAAASFAFVLFLHYRKANTDKRNRLIALAGLSVPLNHLENTWGNLTDKENLEFQYVY